MTGPCAGKWPAFVASYDGPKRECRVRIPGITDGSNVMPLATIEYPIGDRPKADDSKDWTEIRILVGDAVWVEFECGDPRYPIITGFRVPREGNPVDWRRWRHANIEITADGEMVLNATNLTLNIGGNVVEHIGGNRTSDVGGSQQTDVAGDMGSTAANSSHQAGTHDLKADTNITGATSLTGNVTAGGGSFRHAGKNIGGTHTHNEKNVIGGPSDPPNS